jgi:lipoprotein-anchoring transpeptidase ErfK/SrfK
MMPHVSPRHPLLRPTAIGAVLACALALVTASSAFAAPATLTTDARCYLQGAPLSMTATGLAPGAPLTVALDGQTLSYGDGSQPVADQAGTFGSSFATPVLAPGIAQQRHALAVSDGTRRPRARFTVTRPTGADFLPSSGNPRTLRARFRVWGFELVGGVSRVPVWVHWVSPTGTVRQNAALGTTSGDCGTLATAPRRVFPFDAEAGRWVLVFDSNRRYRVQTSGPRAKIPVHVRSIAP